MNIIYFTTAQDKESYNKYLGIWKTPVNSSNQTFHNKLIRSLAINNHVHVVSIRPFSRKLCTVPFLKEGEDIEGSIHWHYLKISKSKLLSISRLRKNINNLFKDFYRNSIIITDTINPTVLFMATLFAKKYHMPCIGVCTDSPSNISGTSRTYTMLILKLAKTLSGYISLTTGLNELFNEQNKASYILEGIVEDDTVVKDKFPKSKYIFYCGALSERYGIYDFISFFKTFIKTDVKFIFCGHHADEEKIHEAIKDDKRITYLGNITNDEVLSYEANAWCNINPRPYSEDLDRFSIPSKVLEYFNSGSPTISVKNTKLQKYFNPDAIWIKNNSPEEFARGFQKFNSFSDKERQTMSARAKARVQELYSLTAVNNKLDSFLYLFTRKR